MYFTFKTCLIPCIKIILLISVITASVLLIHDWIPVTPVSVLPIHDWIPSLDLSIQNLLSFLIFPCQPYLNHIMMNSIQIFAKNLVCSDTET